MEIKCTMPFDGNRNPVPALPYESSAPVAATASTSAASAVIDATFNRMIEVIALDDRVWITQGTEPTAVASAANNIPVEAGTSKWFIVEAGNKIAGIGGPFVYALAK